MKTMGYSQIVIDCSAEKTLTVLKQAQQLGMTGSYHSYLLTSLVRTSYTSETPTGRGSAVHHVDNTRDRLQHFEKFRLR